MLIDFIWFSVIIWLSQFRPTHDSMSNSLRVFLIKSALWFSSFNEFSLERKKLRWQAILNNENSTNSHCCVWKELKLKFLFWYRENERMWHFRQRTILWLTQTQHILNAHSNLYTIYTHTLYLSPFHIFVGDDACKTM